VLLRDHSIDPRVEGEGVIVKTMNHGSVVQSRAWCVGLLAVLGGCSSAELDGPSRVVEGELVLQGGVQRDGRKVTSYALRDAAGHLTQLELPDAGDLKAGDAIKVRGDVIDASKLRVRGLDTIDRTPGVGESQQALVDLGEPRVSRVAVLMAHWGSPDGATPALIRQRLLDDPDSANELFQESSYGKLALEGDVFGWFQVPEPTGCNVGMFATDADAAAAATGVDLSSYDHVLYYFPGRSDCWFGGLGEVGTPASPARRTWYNGWYDPFVLSHELGHNLGFWHSHAYSCGSTIAPRESCTYDEYGDPFDPMGHRTAHFGGYHKMAQGWYEGCDVVTTQRDGVFEIKPTELPTDQTQLLRVPLDPSLCPTFDSSCFYYLEYRQPIGLFDGAPQFQDAPVNEGVLVRANADVDPTGNSGLIGPYLLDMTPGEPHTFWDARLGEGQTFQDSAGVRMRVLSRSSESIRVAIDVPGSHGEARCLDGSTVGVDPACSAGQCGGPCVPCDVGMACAGSSDCWSGLCVAGTCAEPPAACDDGIRNGSETDIDCGGSCDPCSNGKACTVGDDCASGTCSNGVCSAGLLTATLSVHSVWEQGYCGQLELINTGSTPTTDWSGEIDFTDGALTSTSGAQFTHIGNGHYQLTPESWSRVIWPSSYMSVQFCAQITGPAYIPELVYVTSH
jgi:hypothetical protein